MIGIKQLNLLIKHAATLSGIAIILGFVVLIFYPDWHTQMIANLMVDDEPESNARIISLGLIAVLIMLALFGLWHVRALFSQYYDGDIIGKKPASHIMNIGITIIIAPILQGLAILAFFKLSVPAYLHDQYYVALHISGTAYLLLSVGILLVLIGWNMRHVTNSTR